MFHKLKRNMLISNIVILSLFILVIFTTLLVSTYSQIQTKINNELSAIQSRQLQEPGGPVPFARSVSFTIIVEDGEVVELFSDFNFTIETVEDAYYDTVAESGRVKIEDNIFQYLIDVEGETIKASFIDVTRDIELFETQLVTYSIIFLVTIVFASLISYFITGKSVQPVKDSFEKQQEFIANASHELKTPLTVVNTNIDALMTDEDYKDNKWIGYIKSETSRMNKLTNDLLYLAKTDYQNEVVQQSFNASNILEETLLSLEALLYEKKLYLSDRIQPDLEILFDQNQFTQIIMILIDNAIKYTKEEGKITVSFEDVGKYKKLSVLNTGEGIKKEDLNRLFDRFYKVDKSRQNNNSFGLGLSIAKTIMEKNNGSITCDSVEGEYTEFVLRFK